jgi:hypothetical protein
VLANFDGENGKIDGPSESLWQPKSQPAAFLVKVDLETQYKIKCE